jgi:predicted metal-dependent phosphoesterase TrpH
LTPLLQAYPQLVRVFAHPAAGSYPGESLYREVLPDVEIVDRLMPEFLDEDLLGLDGLEVYYPGHVEEHRQLIAAWAQKYGLIETGGSDCHDRVDRPLGVAGVDEERLAILLDRLGEQVPTP